MGCTNSKASASRRYKKASGFLSPTRRSVTLFPRHHLESGRHVASTAKKSISFVDAKALEINDEEERKDGQIVSEKDQFVVGINEAKVWSGLMDEMIPKIVPKTPIRTPPGEPENVNLWEVMAGLEDTSPLIRPVSLSCNSFSFKFAHNPKKDGLESTGQLAQVGIADSNDTDSPAAENVLGCTEVEPKWLEMTSDEKNSIPEFDPEIISMFRNSLEHPLPENRSYVHREIDDDEQCQALEANKTFHSSKKQRVVIYFTSLRGIRKTYEDCYHVRVILKGLKLRVDEKDLSMHSTFKQELKHLLGNSFKDGLPKVFIDKKYIGDADEIRRLHEEGELEKLLEECEMIEFNGYNCNTSCEACGDIRFIPCETCSGSCKIFHDYDDDDGEDKQELADDGFGFRRCFDCNENGLIRCPLCCD